MKFKIFYKKGGNNNSEETKEITSMPSSSNSNELTNENNQNEPTIENNFILDDVINNNKLDHTFIEKIFKFNGVEIQLISLNIGTQIGIWRNNPENNPHDNIYYTMRSNKTLQFIHDETQRKNALDSNNFKNYLRDNGFEKFEFSESDYLYKERLKNTLEVLLKLKKNNNLIICLQEIKKSILENGTFKEICDEFKLNLYGDYNNLISNYGNASCILYNFLDETKIEISQTETEISDLLKVSKLIINDSLEYDPLKINSFDLKISNDGIEEILSLYNIHTNLYENEDALVLMRKIKTRLENKNYIIVGDMNLKLDNVYIYKLTKFFRDIRVNFNLISTPEIEYNINYIDNTSPTYDVFISKGISLLN